jgi:hypothetical protein
MTHCNIQCLLMGEAFSPAHLANLTSLLLTTQTEPGSIGTIGRYKGKPVPDGSAMLEGTDLETVVTALHQHFDILRQVGVTDINLTVTLAYTNQCNWEFAPEPLRLLGEMGITLGVTCYEDSSAL